MTTQHHTSRTHVTHKTAVPARNSSARTGLTPTGQSLGAASQCGWHEYAGTSVHRAHQITAADYTDQEQASCWGLPAGHASTKELARGKCSHDCHCTPHPCRAQSVGPCTCAVGAAFHSALFLVVEYLCRLFLEHGVLHATGAQSPFSCTSRRNTLFVLYENCPV